MSGFFEVVFTAFLFQLIALPGEKGQLIIGSLATKYNPYLVVAGAATAFGGWTVIEILFGTALKGALPEIYLDGMTAGMFVIFAVWVLYSSPNTTANLSTELLPNGGTATSGLFQRSTPSTFRGFWPAFSLMVFGEFGDKTQLVTISLAVQYGATPAIWVGEMLAIVPVSLATALVFDKAAHRLNRVWVHRLAAALFLIFAIDITVTYALGLSILPL